MLKPIFRFFLRIQMFFYRRTGGKFGGTVMGFPILLLNTTGRKTGKKRTTPLGYFEYDNGYVITGSNGGLNSHPGWFHNLRSNPRATIEVNDRQFEVAADVAGPEIRGALWARLIELAPGYAAYEKRTRREIPMVILRPVGA